MQIQLTQTFNVNILNNSYNAAAAGKGRFGANTLAAGSPGQDGDTLNAYTSPRGIRAIASEAGAAFTVVPNAKIPEVSENRREEREESLQNLLRRPKHKQTLRTEASLSQMDKLMSAPLTM